MNPSQTTRSASSSPPGSVTHFVRRALRITLALTPLWLGPMWLTPLLFDSLQTEVDAGGGAIAHLLTQLLAVSVLVAAVARSMKRGPLELRLSYVAASLLAAGIALVARFWPLGFAASGSPSLDGHMQLQLVLQSLEKGFATWVHFGAGLSALLFVIALLWLFAPAPPAARAARTGVRWVLPGFAALVATVMMATLAQGRSFLVSPAVLCGLSRGALVLGAASSFALWRSDRHAEPTRAGGEALWAATLTSFGAALALVTASFAAERASTVHALTHRMPEVPLTLADLQLAWFPHAQPIGGFTLLLSLLSVAPVLLAALLHRTPKDQAPPLTHVLVGGGFVAIVAPLALLLTLASKQYAPAPHKRPAAVSAEPAERDTPQP